MTDELVAAAVRVRANAYAPHSRFRVGAALRCRSGAVHVGCNVENVSYGLTNCAERVAVGAAVAAGERDFDRIAVATVSGAYPCGACLQVLAEFAPKLAVSIVTIDDAGGVAAVAEHVLSDFLPLAFRDFPGG